MKITELEKKQTVGFTVYQQSRQTSLTTFFFFLKEKGHNYLNSGLNKYEENFKTTVL